MWWDGIRKLTDDEKKKIYSYLEQRKATRFYPKIVADDELSMDFLEYAEKNEPFSCDTIMYLVVD